VPGWLHQQSLRFLKEDSDKLGAACKITLTMVFMTVPQRAHGGGETTELLWR